MSDVYFEEIRQLTTQASELVAELNIAECQNLLNERQKLLQQLSELVFKDEDLLLETQFSELLIWIQSVDDKALELCLKYRADYHDKLVIQTKVSKAMQVYKKY